MHIKKLVLQYNSIIAISFIFFSSCMATPTTPDLSSLAISNNWQGDIVDIKQRQKEDSIAIEFNTSGESLVWINDLNFKSGTIEFDAKGKSTPRQGSFIGVAFRVLNAKAFDVIYFRPFNFNASDPINKSHAVQYMSEPHAPWYTLRDKKPGQYEKPITPAPNGDDWFHVKLILENRQIQVFINGKSDASLVVKELSDREGGSIGLWCNGYGSIANLQFTPTK